MTALVLSGLTATPVCGIGISPADANITLEVGNTNLVALTFKVSFSTAEQGLTYWTTNNFAASEEVWANVFFSFDPVTRVTGFETPSIQGDPNNDQAVYLHKVYIAAASPDAEARDYAVDLVVSERWWPCDLPGCVFPGLLAPIRARVIPKPFATDQVLTTTEDMPVVLHLGSVSQTGSLVTYTVLSGPAFGRLSGTPPDLTYTPDKNFAGSDHFTFKVNSGGRDSDAATVGVTVNELNTAPVLLALPDQIVFAGGSLNLNVATAQVRGLLRLVFDGIAGSALADLTNASRFPDDPSIITLLTDRFETPHNAGDWYGQLVRGWLDPPRTGEYTFHIESDDEAALYLSTDDQPGHCVQIAGNLAAGQSQSPPINLERGKTYYIEVLMKEGFGEDFLRVRWRPPDAAWELIPAVCIVAGPAVLDTDIPPDVLTFELLSGPDGLTFDTAGGLLAWTPGESQVPSTNLVSLKVSDDGTPSLSATQNFAIFALPANRQPVLIVPPDQTIDELTTLTLTNLASEAAYPTLHLTFSLEGAPAGASINPTNGLFTWTPTEAQGPSTNRICVRVTDDGIPGVGVTNSFSVVVREVNQFPTVRLLSPSEGGAFTLPASIPIQAEAQDEDGDLGEVEFLDGPLRLAEITTPPFLFAWTNAQPGRHVLRARAWDSAGASADSAPVAIRVLDPPCLTPLPFVASQAFRMMLTGGAGLDYLVETSTNLTDWVPLATNRLGALGTWELADLQAPGFVQRFYRACLQPIARIWVDDALPVGAEPGGNEGWNWITRDPTPFSGNFASQSGLGPGEHNHYFVAATEILAINTGDVLFAYVYLDPENLPGEVMLQWYDGSFEHRAYWGADLIQWGTNGTASRRHIGVLPVAGQWVRLQVPASLVELQGSVVTGLGFTLYDGRATWDCAGKLSP